MDIMRTYLLIVLLILSAQFAYGQSYVATQDINVRKGAGTKYEIIGVISSGPPIEVLDSNGKWSKINYQGTEGYISTKFLQTTTAENVSTINSGTPASSIKLKAWLILGVIVLLLLFRTTRRLLVRIFKLVLPETARNFTGSSTQSKQVYCAKCGEAKKTGVVKNTLDCSGGGRHEWRAN